MHSGHFRLTFHTTLKVKVLCLVFRFFFLGRGGEGGIVSFIFELFGLHIEFLLKGGLKLFKIIFAV